MHIRWTQTLTKAGWLIAGPDGPPSSHLFSKWRLWRVPRSLHDQRLESRFKHLVESNLTFVKFWHETCGERGEHVFLLDFKQGAWDLPWELLLKALINPRNRESVYIARTAGVQHPEATSVSDEALRLLIVKGGAVLRRGAPSLDLDKEIDLICATWKQGLEQQVRERIDKPEVCKALDEELTAALRRYRPHVIWFSGHGRNRESVEIQFADGTWVRSSELAGLLKASGITPWYAVFWACDTGTTTGRDRELAQAPSLFEDLRRIGVQSILAMQAPISDEGARAMAAELFRGMANGRPLERAIAMARAKLIDATPVGMFPLDWATPVVWSAGPPIPKLTWKAGSTKLTQLQLLGRITLEVTSAPGQITCPSRPAELDRGRGWGEIRRLWIKADPAEAEITNEWIRFLQAVQSTSTRFIISIDLPPEDPAAGLQVWADKITARLVPGELPSEVVGTLKQARDNPTSGFPKLCRLEGMHLAIAAPPLLNHSWFWHAVSEAPGHVVVLSSRAPDAAMLEDWQVEMIGRASDEKQVETAIMQAPRLARAMALLNWPIRASYLALPQEAKDSVYRYVDWSQRTVVSVETDAGPVLTATARAKAMLMLAASDKERILGHDDCLHFLDNSHLSQTTALWEQRLTHLLAAGRHDDAVKEAGRLLEEYQGQNQPAAALKVVNNLAGLKDMLTTRSQLIVAWACTRIGDMDYARWLLRSHQVLPLDQAWKHGLLSEVEKAAGNYDKCKEELTKAIEICAAVTAQSPDYNRALRQWMAYRQDLARAWQYLDHEYKTAAQEYEKLLREWAGLNASELDLAVLKRNYGECLRSLAEKDEAAFQQAHDMLSEAEDLARRHPVDPVFAEILYARSRLAAKENQPIEATRLLDMCADAAQTSSHEMLAAIVDSRRFWQKGPYTPPQWQFVEGQYREIESRLEVFSENGWAVRTAIDARFRVAELQETGGNFEEARKVLLRNLELLADHPGYSRGSDQLRVARTLSGLQVISERLHHQGGYWEQLQTKHPWTPTWLAKRGLDTPEKAWRWRE